MVLTFPSLSWEEEDLHVFHLVSFVAVLCFFLHRKNIALCCWLTYYIFCDLNIAYAQSCSVQTFLNYCRGCRLVGNVVKIQFQVNTLVGRRFLMLTKNCVSQQCEHVTNNTASDQIAFLVSSHINFCESLEIFTSILLVHFPIR